MKKSTIRKKPAERRHQVSPVLRENEWSLRARDLCELYPMARFIKKSYVLSRFWAWCSQIQLQPRVRIPVPRFLTYRDP